MNYTIVYRAPPSWQGRVPYALGAVELLEGITVTAEIVDCCFDEIRIPMAMELTTRVGGHDSLNNPIVVFKWAPASPRPGGTS